MVPHGDVNAGNHDQSEEGCETAFHPDGPIFYQRLRSIRRVRNHFVDLSPLQKDRHRDKTPEVRVDKVCQVHHSEEVLLVERQIEGEARPREGREAPLENDQTDESQRAFVAIGLVLEERQDRTEQCDEAESEK